MGCTGLTTISLPEGVTEIGECAFWGCTSLASFSIPEGVTEIGEDAFQSCKALASVVGPESVIAIGENAFGFPPLTVACSEDSYAHRYCKYRDRPTKPKLIWP